MICPECKGEKFFLAGHNSSDLVSCWRCNGQGEVVPKFDQFINKIIYGDCLKSFKEIPDNSIDLVVTSPPYNAARNYMDYDDNLPLDSYHAFLKNVCSEVFRVIKPNGNIFINICDIGISNRDAKGDKKIGERGNFYVIPHHVVIVSHMLTLKNCQYLNPIIWRKPSNCKSQFGTNARFAGTYPYPASLHVPSEIEFILHFRKNGIYQKVDKQIKEKSRLTKERWFEISSQIWEFNGVNSKEHPAQFPVELPARCIEAWSFIGDVVLDPFMGLGTTAVAAKERGRNFIGFELSPNYCQMARERVASL
jgi:modification methylase